jgi:hypothetical protein
VLRKRLFRAILILGAAAIPATTPGCSDSSGPGCQPLGEKCGSNDEPYFNCCAGLECTIIPQGDRLIHRREDPNSPSLIES